MERSAGVPRLASQPCERQKTLNTKTRAVGNNSGVKRQLRLLTQPLFRYPVANAKATYLDGALFAFVEGTDPEAFLLLEAVKAKNNFGQAPIGSR